MRTLDEIYEEMCGDYAVKTGTAVIDGGDMAVRLYAAAAQIHSLWVQAEYLKRQAFPQTADGEYLDRHASVRGLERGHELCAEGEIDFYTDEETVQALPVPEGTICLSAAGAEFVTVAAGEIPAGESHCSVPARAVLPGVGGNIPADSIVGFEQAPVGISGCGNEAAFSGGADMESDESLRKRVIESYKMLPDGANAAFYEKTVQDIDGVAAAAVFPKRRGTGTVDIIFSAEDGVPSSAMVAQVQDELDEKREMCVDIEVSAPETVEVNVDVEVLPDDRTDFSELAERIEECIRSYFGGKLLGQDVLRAKLGNLIYSVGGVENYSLISPPADVSAQSDELPVLGTVTVSLME